MGRIGRKRKYSKSGGSWNRKPSAAPRCSPPEPPKLRPRRERTHHKSIRDVAVNLEDESLWRSRRVAIYVLWRDTFLAPDPKCWKGKDGTIMAIQHRTRPLFGLQFHPESILSGENGLNILANFSRMMARYADGARLFSERDTEPEWRQRTTELGLEDAFPRQYRT